MLSTQLRNAAIVATASIVLLFITDLYVSRFEIFGMPVGWAEVEARGVLRVGVVRGDTLFEQRARLFAAEQGVDCETRECANEAEALILLLEEDVELVRVDRGRGVYGWTVRDSTDLRDSVDLWYDRRVRHISRWDSCFHRAADSIGWDWKLLAAIGRVESGFRNVSGGTGLGVMQLSRSTANRFGARGRGAMQPCTNIMAAARYLEYLETFFTDIESDEERHKFAIAAYNSGMSAVTAARRRAESHKRDSTVWAEVERYYRNGHSKRYLHKILRTYERYKTKS